MTGMAQSDPWEDPLAKQWVRHVLDEMVPKMASSAIVAQIVPDVEGDVKFWVEMGAAIMMDKPIIAVVFGDREPPAKLAAVADEVCAAARWSEPSGSEELTAAIKRLSTGL